MRNEGITKYADGAKWLTYGIKGQHGVFAEIALTAQ